MYMHQPGQPTSDRKRPITKHRCAVCDRWVPIRLLMCGEHWRLVPADLQLAVYRTWNALSRAAHRMSYARCRREYDQASNAAISFVASLIKGETPEPETPLPKGD